MVGQQEINLEEILDDNTWKKMFLKYYYKSPSPSLYKQLLDGVFSLPSLSTIGRWHAVLHKIKCINTRTMENWVEKMLCQKRY